eukprot:3220675-Karenia_brevis.AAC.1
MVSGTGVAMADPVDLAQPEVYGVNITHTNQKPRGIQGRDTKKMNQGLRICGVNITPPGG